MDGDNSLEEEGSLAKDEWGSHDTLEGEGQGGSEASFKVDPFEESSPISGTVRLGELVRDLDLLADTSIFVIDIVTLNIPDQSSECSLCFVVLIVHAEPG